VGALGHIGRQVASSSDLGRLLGPRAQRPRHRRAADKRKGNPPTPPKIGSQCNALCTSVMRLATSSASVAIDGGVDCHVDAADNHRQQARSKRNGEPEVGLACPGASPLFMTPAVQASLVARRAGTLDLRELGLAKP
jgi:hypothetical protein